MAIDMRHLKLKPEEAALLAGELKKPNWQSKNEGIHERVSFEDSIWGFDLAGGSYYNTPLRVVGVKKGSRAEKAGIRLGDKLKRINDIETSTLTIQEAHEIIIASGVHLKIAVTAPEDEEDAYYCYEDPTESGYDSEEERRRLLEEKIKKRAVHAKVSSYWSLQWPWVSKRRVIYRESNCFMVPSKYESKHKEQFPPQPTLRIEDDIVRQKTNNKVCEESSNQSNGRENNLSNGNLPNGDLNSVQNGNVENKLENISHNKSLINKNGINQDDEKQMNGNSKDTPDLEENINTDEVIENYDKISADKGISDAEEKTNHKVTEELDNEKNKITKILDVKDDSSHDKITEDFNEDTEVVEEIEDNISTINDESSTMNDEDNISQEDEVIKEVLADDGDISTDDDRIMDSILSDGVDNRRNNSESER